jgi:hypothetical protein
VPQPIGFGAATMLKKPFHNHYFYQTNPKTQRKSKTKPNTQPPSKLVHTKHSLQQPKRKPARHKEYPCRFFLLKIALLQLPTLKKRLYFYNNNQTKPKK